MKKVISIIIFTLFLTISTVVVADNKANFDINLQDNQSNNIKNINITFESENYTLYGQIFYPSESGLYPGIVFCEGLAGYSEAYNWIPKALAEQGYVALFFDFPGQGRSEGIFGNRSISIPFLNFYLRFSAFLEPCFHYFRGDFVIVTMDAITYLTNESPVRNLVDSEKLGLIGHSLGSVIVTETAAQDSRVKTVVALSVGNNLLIDKINVPIQFQGGGLDIPIVGLPIILLRCYSKANTPKELIMIKHGTHIGFTSAFGKLCLCPRWQKEICLKYVTGWFDYFLKNKSEAYDNITNGGDHLSKILRSRYNFGYGEHILK